MKISPDNHNRAINENEILSEEEVETRIIESLKYLENMGLPLALENLDYHPGGAYEYVCEQTFIEKILRKTNAGLLLDIAHAEISAIGLSKTNNKNQQVTNNDLIEITRDYLKKLPLDRVVQLHLNAPSWRRNRLMDMHLPFTMIEEALLKDLVHLPNLKIITLESKESLLEQVKRLRKLLE